MASSKEAVSAGANRSLSVSDMAWGGSTVPAPVEPGRPSQPWYRSASGVLSALTILLVIATITGFGLAVGLAHQADNEVETGHRLALDRAIEALQAVAPDLGPDAPRLIRVLRQASGLEDLQFSETAPDSGRAQRLLFDPKGRLVGWFSWQVEQTTTAAVMRMLPAAVVVAFGLTGLLGLATWLLRRQSLRLAASERMRLKLVHEEPLTGLPNRDEMLIRLDRALESRGEDECVAFVIIDLDAFVDVEDAIGDAKGDEALIEIANRLRATMPSDVLVGRGRNRHKFALVVRSAMPEEALAAAEAARDAVFRPMWFGLAVQVGACVGLAVAPRDGSRRDELVHRADLALRAARLRGTGSVVRFTAEMETQLEERLFIKRELVRALTARSFDVHYQPILRADGNAIVGVEALLRWSHPARGAIDQTVFIPVAEQAGLMDSARRIRSAPRAFGCGALARPLCRRQSGRRRRCATASSSISWIRSWRKRKCQRRASSSRSPRAC